MRCVLKGCENETDGKSAVCEPCIEKAAMPLKWLKEHGMLDHVIEKYQKEKAEAPADAETAFRR